MEAAMSNLTPEREYELRNREISVKEKEAARSSWKNPTIAAALIAAAVAVVGHTLVSRHNTAELDLAKQTSTAEQELAQKQFCYTALTDHLNRHAAGRPDWAGKELRIVADTFTSSGSCIEALREASDNLFAADARGTGPEATTKPPSGIAQVDEQRCKLIKSIRSLGWTGGHKTNFCKKKGYDGVFNPYGDYSAGGFCFQGDAEACKTQALKSI
jgi:hypothetical protein